MPACQAARVARMALLIISRGRRRSATVRYPSPPVGTNPARPCTRTGRRSCRSPASRCTGQGRAGMVRRVGHTQTSRSSQASTMNVCSLPAAHLYHSFPSASYRAAQAASTVFCFQPPLAGGGGGALTGEPGCGDGPSAAPSDGGGAGTGRSNDSSSCCCVSTVTAPAASTPATPASGTAWSGPPSSSRQPMRTSGWRQGSACQHACMHATCGRASLCSLAPHHPGSPSEAASSRQRLALES